MKRVLLIINFLVVSILCTAQTDNKRGFALGAGTGYTNDGMFVPDVFGRIDFKTKKVVMKAKFGFNYHPFNAQFQGIKELKSEGTGLFAEGDIYPFRKYLFAGLRWDLITFNWLTNSALKVIKTNKSYIGFTGTNIYGVAGLDMPVYQNINFLLYGMFGVQQYKISDGEFSSGNYIVNGSAQESHTRFVYQLNVAVSIQIR